MNFRKSVCIIKQRKGKEEEEEKETNRDALDEDVGEIILSNAAEDDRGTGLADHPLEGADGVLGSASGDVGHLVVPDEDSGDLSRLVRRECGVVELQSIPLCVRFCLCFVQREEEEEEGRE